jgi:histidyl-tRNA synthetase
VELFVALEDASAEVRIAGFALLTEARSAGLAAQMDLGGRSLKGQLGHANAIGARFVAILGAGDTTLRDMQGGSQTTIATEAVVHSVLRGQHAL